MHDREGAVDGGGAAGCGPAGSQWRREPKVNVVGRLRVAWLDEPPGGGWRGR